ncbi:MAG: HNH endonuclease [Oscillospiraceae bacterium]|nr:HNH endonuclease [Oscillospiraceae bacterium]
MSTYYLKKCGHQELGSVGADGRPNRGRYLLTSMNEDVLSFFPPLSTAQLNDSALLPIIPLYSGDKVYCNFVYHNDKFHGSTAVHPRNEYRLYLNRSLEGDTFRFRENDIAVFRIEEFTEDDMTQNVYLLDLVPNDNSAYYRELNQIIEDSPIRGGYGMYNGTLPDFEMHAENTLTQHNAVTVIDDTVTRRIEDTPANNIADLFNAATFRDFVMTGYNYLCAVTGTVIRYQDFTNLEAAHIKPRSHGGLYLPNNGIAMCRDLHWAFDKGFFTLTDDLKIQVHPQIQSDYLRAFDNQSIRIPGNPFFVPDVENIRYHREAVYGLFLTTGRL